MYLAVAHPRTERGTKPTDTEGIGCENLMQVREIGVFYKKGTI